MKGWADAISVKTLTRQEILDYCDLIDALDEAAYDERQEQDRKQPTKPNGRKSKGVRG